MAEYEDLCLAVEKFIRANCNIESSVPIAATMDDIAQARTLQDVFMAPIQHQLFGMDAALRWVLFLSVASEEDENGNLPYGKRFSCRTAMSTVAQVYDIGVQDAVWEHFEDDEDEDDEDEDEDEAADGAAVTAAE